MIQDVDETLRRLLTAQLAKAPGPPGAATPRVTFDPPDAAESDPGKGPRVNFYLHDVRENLSLRDETYHALRKPGEPNVAGRRRAPVRLDLSYIATTHADGDPVLEHRLLADVLAALLKHPVVPPEYMAEGLRETCDGPLPLSIAQPDHLAYANPPVLWQALGGKMRPALSLVVTIPFDPFETRWARVVREAILAIGEGVPPRGPRRPLEVSDVRVSAAGVVTDSVGQTPLAGVTVSVSDLEAKATTDERGFFYFLNLPAGPYVLTFHKVGYQPQECRVVAPPMGRPDQLEPVVAALEPADDRQRATEIALLAEAEANSAGLVEMERVYRVAMSGRLKYADGRPAAFVPVRVGRQSTLTDADGVYFFFNLPPGDHEVVADVPGRGEVEVMTQDGAEVLAAPDTGKRARK